MPRGSTDRDDREVGGAWSNFQRHWYGDPSPGLAPFVTQYWLAAWDLRGQPPFRQLIVPSLNVHLSFVGDAGPVVRGVGGRRVFWTLDGTGRAFGVAFRPGCFRPFLKAPVSTITGRSISARAVFGPDLPEQAMAGAADETELVRVIERSSSATCWRICLPAIPLQQRWLALWREFPRSPTSPAWAPSPTGPDSACGACSGSSPSTWVSDRNGSSGTTG